MDAIFWFLISITGIVYLMVGGLFTRWFLNKFMDDNDDNKGSLLNRLILIVFWLPFLVISISITPIIGIIHYIITGDWNWDD